VIASRSIRYLITPSGSKVAYTSSDLSAYVEATPARVAELLECLCDLRIMRPLPPTDGSQEPRYEIFHDLLANPMFEWRGRFEAQRLWARMRWLLAGLSAAVAAALAITAYSTQPAPLQRLELRSIDTRFAMRGTVAPDRDIVIVNVDEATLKALHARQPSLYLRPVYAKVIDRLLAAKANVIADDLEFGEVGRSRALFDAIKRAHGQIVLVSELFDSKGFVPLFGEEGEEGAAELLGKLNNAKPAYGGFPLDAGEIFRRVRYTAPICEEYTAQNCEADRRKPLLSFAVAAAELAEHHTIPRFTGKTLIDYHGPVHTFTTVPMIDVLRGQVDPSLFAGKIVVIGASGGDLHRTPFTPKPTMPGAEIQANAISTVRHGPALRAAGTGTACLLALALSMTALLVAAVRWRMALAIFVTVAALYLLLAQLFFDNGLYLPLVYPLLALALAGAGTLLARIYLARQSSRQRRGVTAFSASGSPTSTEPQLLHGVGVA
jgi:CHASE2 domain-containing sensor protein